MTLRVAVAGAGWVSVHHLAAWRTLPEVDVVAICDPDTARAAARAAEFGIALTFTDAAEMLERTRPDALDIAAPVEAHAGLCRLAAERGVHILCQKPLASTLEEARAIVAAVGGRVRLMVHENWRFRPQYRQIRRWLEDGELGEPVSCAMRVRASGLLPDTQGRLPQLERQPFFAVLERLVIGEVLIHHLDVVRWLMGPLDVVMARAGRLCPAVRGEDHALIVLAGNGRWAVVDGSLVTAGGPGKSADAFELLGTRGTAVLEGTVVRLHGSREECIRLDLDAAYRASYAGAIGHFAEALHSGAQFETGPDDNLQTLVLVEHAYAALGR